MFVAGNLCDIIGQMIYRSGSIYNVVMHNKKEFIKHSNEVSLFQRCFKKNSSKWEQSVQLINLNQIQPSASCCTPSDERSCRESWPALHMEGIPYILIWKLEQGPRGALERPPSARRPPSDSTFQKLRLLITVNKTWLIIQQLPP